MHDHITFVGAETSSDFELSPQERLKEIKEWTRQCLAFRRELRSLEGAVAEMESLKRETLKLQKDLLQGNSSLLEHER